MQIQVCDVTKVPFKSLEPHDTCAVEGVFWRRVTRATHTNLDMLQESSNDDFWNLDVDRNMSDPWTGFTKFTLLNEKLPKGCLWIGRRLTTIQATTSLDCLWLEKWSRFSKAIQEKHEWATENERSMMLGS